MRDIAFGQLPEIIYIDGNLFSLYSTPLLPWLEAQEPTLSFDLRTPRCERAYVGKWALENEKLLLIGLTAWRNGKYTSVRALFDGEHEVLADWFSGPLMIEPTSHAVRDGEYPKAKILAIHQGQLVEALPS